MTLYNSRRTYAIVSKLKQVFFQWYDSKKNCMEVLNEASSFVTNKLFIPMAEEVIEICNENDVYSVDADILLRQYAKDADDPWATVCCDMLMKLKEIDDNQAAEKQYREYRKETRGRVVGGGFGLGGALKGMVQAGMINAVTGAAHSVANVVGNTGTNLAASSERSSLYKNSKESFWKALYQSALQIEECMMYALEKEAGIRFQIITQEDADKCAAILVNYNTGKIPYDKKIDLLIEALHLNPYNEVIYQNLWRDFPYQQGDLLKMSEYFEVELQKYARSYTEDFARDTFNDNCGLLNHETNKPVASVKYEEEIRQTYEKILEFCDEHGMKAEDNSIVQRCVGLLEDIDDTLKTAIGIKWDTREIAQAVKRDNQKFYDCLADKELTQEELAGEEIKSKVFNLPYETEEFKELLDEKYKKEIELRNPVKLFDNVGKIVKESFKDKEKLLDKVNVSRIDETFEKKEKIIRDIVNMPLSETMVFLFDRTSNGKGKSGILLTNLNMRIYSKGIFSDENIVCALENIQDIVCVGEGAYYINSDSKRIDFSYENDHMSIVDENLLAQLLFRLIFVIRNIPLQIRSQLGNIYIDSVRCTCGHYLFANETICPVCQKMRLQDGRMEETKQCPCCGKIMLKDKKFCSQCGRILEDIIQIDIDRQKTEKSETEGSNIKSEPLVRYCTQCGNVIKPGKKYCTQCGTKVVEREEK